MYLAVSGHRPEKISDPEGVREAIRFAFLSLEPAAIYCGMAAGVDLWAGKIALNMDIAVLAVRPWAGHGPRKADEDMYDEIINNAAEVHILNKSETYPGPWVYHSRNHYMVDNAHKVLAVWDWGKVGGTAECVQYAQAVRKKIYHINPDTGEAIWLAQP